MIKQSSGRPSSKVYVSKAEDIPKVAHFAIFETSSYTTEASGEWAPGHGYPAATHNFVTYVAFTDESEFLEELKEKNATRNFGSRTFRGVKVSAPYTFEAILKAPDEKPTLTFPRD